MLDLLRGRTNDELVRRFGLQRACVDRRSEIHQDVLLLISEVRGVNAIEDWRSTHLFLVVLERVLIDFIKRLNALPSLAQQRPSVL